MTVAGLLLAAGAGTRMGRPKALVVDADGTSWLARGVEALRAGGCDEVAVVLGAAVDEARGVRPRRRRGRGGRRLGRGDVGIPACRP